MDLGAAEMWAHWEARWGTCDTFRDLIAERAGGHVTHSWVHWGARRGTCDKFRGVSVKRILTKTGIYPCMPLDSLANKYTEELCGLEAHCRLDIRWLFRCSLVVS